MATVFSVKVWDEGGRQWVLDPFRRTSIGAKLISAHVLWETADEVDPNDIDHYGRYLPGREQDKLNDRW